MQFRKNAKQKLATAKLNLACDHKIIPACMEMGTFHAEKGEFIEAKKNFKIACDLDHLKGCYHFKYLIIRGSEKKALQLIYEKCLEHDETACIELKKFP